MPDKVEEAINEAVDKVVSENYEKRINDLVPRFKDKDVDEATEIIKSLVKYDPTKNKRYLAFIVGVYLKDTTIEFPEDGGRVLQALTGFDALKVKKKWKHEPDILKYQSTFREFEKYVLAGLEEHGMMSDRAMKYKIQGGEEVDGTEWVFDDRDIFKSSASYAEKGDEWLDKAAMFKVLRIDDAKPATYLAQGTALCTCDEETANKYLALGPLYMVFKNGRPWVQFTHDFSSFMNTGDQVVSLLSQRTDLFLGMLERSIDLPDKALVNIAKTRLKADKSSNIPILAKEKKLI